MSTKQIMWCCACGRTGHKARIVKPQPGLPNGAYICPTYGPWGDVVAPTSEHRCGRCGASGFDYANGRHTSSNGTRGYRCNTCGAIKPERTNET